MGTCRNHLVLFQLGWVSEVASSRSPQGRQMCCVLGLPIAVSDTPSPLRASHALLLQPPSERTPQHRGVIPSFGFFFLMGLCQVLSSPLNASWVANLVPMNARKGEIDLGVKGL